MSTGFVAFILYLFTIIENAKEFLDAMVIISTVAVVTCIVGAVLWTVHLSDAYRLTSDDSRKAKSVSDRNDFVKTIKTRLIPLAVFLALFNALLPDQRGMMLIVGGALGYEGVQAVVSDERVQETGGKVFDLMNTWLDEQTRSLKNDLTEEAAADTVEQ